MSKKLQKLKEKLAQAKAQLKEKNETFKDAMKLYTAAKEELAKHDKITNRLDGILGKASDKVANIEHDIGLEKDLIETKKQVAKEKAEEKAAAKQAKQDRAESGPPVQ